MEMTNYWQVTVRKTLRAFFWDLSAPDFGILFIIRKFVCFGRAHTKTILLVYSILVTWHHNQLAACHRFRNWLIGRSGNKLSNQGVKSQSEKFSLHVTWYDLWRTYKHKGQVSAFGWVKCNKYSNMKRFWTGPGGFFAAGRALIQRVYAIERAGRACPALGHARIK